MAHVLETLAQLSCACIETSALDGMSCLEDYRFAGGEAIRSQQHTASARAFPAAVVMPRRFLTPAAVRFSNHVFAVRRRHFGRRRRSSCDHHG